MGISAGLLLKIVRGKAASQMVQEIYAQVSDRSSNTLDRSNAARLRYFFAITSGSSVGSNPSLG